MKKIMGFRQRENLEIVEFITKKTDVPMEIIILAVDNMRENDFHNVDHILSATRAAIEIAIVEKRSKQQINLLTLIMLFHDACHTGVATPTDEMVAAMTALKVIPRDILEICRENNFQNPANMLRDGILASCFSMRGNIFDSFLRIVQDADIHACAVSANYWMYSCSGLGIEMANQLHSATLADPVNFWKGNVANVQDDFVLFLESITKSRNILLSHGAKNLWQGVARDNLNEIKSWNDEKIFQAFNIRRSDITFAEFEAIM